MAKVGVQLDRRIVEQIRSMRAAGVSLRQIARDVGISLFAVKKYAKPQPPSEIDRMPCPPFGSPGWEYAFREIARDV